MTAHHTSRHILFSYVYSPIQSYVKDTSTRIRTKKRQIFFIHTFYIHHLFTTLIKLFIISNIITNWQPNFTVTTI